VFCDVVESSAAASAIQRPEEENETVYLSCKSTELVSKSFCGDCHYFKPGGFTEDCFTWFGVFRIERTSKLLERFAFWCVSGRAGSRVFFFW
jgi:hypothetical protein